MLRPARVPNRTSRPPSCTLRQQHVTLKCMLNPGQSCLGSGSCLLLRQAPITDCRPPLALQFHEWPTPFARCTPPPPIPLTYPRPAFILACPPACLHTHAPSPSASASALRSISTACSFPHPPCPALVQGFFSLSLYRALRCDHPLTHLLSPYIPAATFYPPPAMRAACT